MPRDDDRQTDNAEKTRITVLQTCLFLRICKFPKNWNTFCKIQTLTGIDTEALFFAFHTRKPTNRNQNENKRVVEQKQQQLYSSLYNGHSVWGNGKHSAAAMVAMVSIDTSHLLTCVPLRTSSVSSHPTTDGRHHLETINTMLLLKVPSPAADYRPVTIHPSIVDRNRLSKIHEERRSFRCRNVATFYYRPL